MAAVPDRAPAAARPARRPVRVVARGRAPARARWRDVVGYAGLRGAVGLLAALPLRVALRLGAFVAWLVWLLDRPHRRIGLTNLAIAFPDRPLFERRRILRASFMNLGRMAAELAHLPKLSAAELREMVTFADEAWWQEAIGWERATGVLVLGGHFGNWELGVYAQGMRGHPVSMVHRAIGNPLVDRWLNDWRARAGTRLIRKASASKDVLRAMHERQLLILPFDQNSTRGLGVFVDFFGVPASTNAGIARIALRTGAPIVPVFIVRQGASARHVVHVLPVLEAEHTGDFDADVRRNTERFSAVFEDMVRRYPEQWLWMHKRWKTRPAGAPRIY